MELVELTQLPEIDLPVISSLVFRVNRLILTFQMATAAKGKILAVIGDEDTVVGFLLGGVGELNKV